MMYLTWRDLEKTTVVSRRNEQFMIEVLNRDSSAAEFMDPNDWKVKAVSLPYDDDGVQSSLRIALIADEWVALPTLAGGGISE